MGAKDGRQGQMGSNAGTEEHRQGLRSRGMDSPKDWFCAEHQGTRKTEGPSDNQQPTRNEEPRRSTGTRSRAEDQWEPSRGAEDQWEPRTNRS